MGSAAATAAVRPGCCLVPSRSCVHHLPNREAAALSWWLSLPPGQVVQHSNSHSQKWVWNACYLEVPSSPGTRFILTASLCSLFQGSHCSDRRILVPFSVPTAELQKMGCSPPYRGSAPCCGNPSLVPCGMESALGVDTFLAEDSEGIIPACTR